MGREPHTLPSRGKSVFVVTTITFVLATISVVARLISRFGITKHRTADDWIIILAWFLAFGLSFAIDFGVSKGLGRHDVDIPKSWLGALRGSEYAFTILYNPALMATKTSILIFYLRMSRHTQSVLRIASCVTLAVVNVGGVVLTFLNAFQCNPVRAAYDPTVSNQKCFSIVTLYLCSAPFNIITDLAILVLPIPVLTGIRLPQRQKTVLVFTFALGIFVTIVDVVRIYYLQQADDNQNIVHLRLGTGVDFSWTVSAVLMWSAVEVNVGIICACVPTLRPLIKKILPSMITDRASKGSQTNSTGRSKFIPSRLPKELSADPQHPAVAESNAGLQALPPAHVESDQNAEIDMMGFLTMPDGMGEPGMLQTHTAHTAATENTVYFGFVNMRKPKSMLKTKGIESFKYCTLVTILFFLWGFSYGLLNTLNAEITRISGQTLSENLGLSSTYFFGYLCGPLTVGQWTLRAGGFKVTFITGLIIYGIGTLMFWPSAVLTSFPGFVISTFVVGFGLAVTETAANPFLALCGPSAYAESRLLTAQAIQAIGSILSQLLAQKVLFRYVSSHPSLIDVQWTYLAVALFTVILALFFYYMPLPEATDEDLQAQAESLGIYPQQTITLIPKLKFSLITTSLVAALVTQFLYVGAQESVSIWFGHLLYQLSGETRKPLTLDTANYGLVGHATFSLGRFIFAGLCLFITPRLLLLVTFVGTIIFAALTMSISTDGNGIAGPVLVLLFFEGPIWPLIFVTGLRGLGKKTKMGASLLTAAACGGAVFPLVMLAVQRVNKRTIQYSFCIVLALYCFGILYPITLSFSPQLRTMVDPMKEGDLLLRDEGVLGDGDGHGADTPMRRLSRWLSVILENIKGATQGGREEEGGWIERRVSKGRTGD
ncbi:uncharacterized protein L3040_005794 [Drepanopeziza brunnea f. sp. 'multigermtubi']|uniref:uncharacterized protein n=1 Tax=Drepanopeziza brunnea f. sp. 'multigermtubi' TaxID=698441 RepID=UPI00238B57B3|nr:hypothetical protein L3040_005794 [Drepanopeziza brunnea f. sp. 'multigermtubi']